MIEKKTKGNFKVLTITCHRTQNYGAILQTYALAKYLSSQGFEVEVIDYCPSSKSKKNILKRIGSYFIRKPDYFKGKKTFGSFLNKYIKLTDKKYYSYEQLKECPPIADAYIVGSDQVWNCNMQNGNDDSY